MTEKQIFDYLKQRGMTDAGASGMIGNMIAESGLSPINLENSKEGRYNDATYTQAVNNGSYSRDQFCNDRSGYGLCQWTSAGRKAGLYDLAKQRGVSIGDAKTQLDHLINELNSSYSSVMKVLKTTNSIREASDAVLLRFEVPYDRGENAQKYRASLGQGVYDRCAKMGETKVETMVESRSGFQFHNPIRTNTEFAETAIEIAKNYKTYYVNGAWGWSMTPAMKQRAINNKDTPYNKAHASQIMALPDGVFGFDCNGTIKGILWHWCGDYSKQYGGAGYACNGVPDINENAMIQRCNGVSSNFSNILIGEMLWMDGHAGIYIGDGFAVECTPSWANGVQITAVANMGQKQGYNSRKWTKHGMLPYFRYINGVQPSIPPTQKPTTQGETVYTVKSGDTLSSIASRYGTTWQQLAQQNNIANPNIIHVGQKIVIGNSANSSQSQPSVTYTVKSGDTLSSIASRFGTTYQKIAQDNNIANPNVIHVGQRLVIRK